MRTLFVTVLLASRFLASEACKFQPRCTYGKYCWPTADDFRELEYRVSQPLIYPRPSAAPCYPPSNPSPNCIDVRARWTDTNWRSSNPGSMEYPNWEMYRIPDGGTCYLNTSITGACWQGRVPPVGVDVRSVSDLKETITFVSKYNLKTVIKNTGHDYLGRSASPDAFVLWTHNLKNITYDRAFVPDGGPENQTWTAVTVYAGVQWSEAYAAVAKYGQIIVGAIDLEGSVGAAGGWLLGTGHSFLSPSHGLGVDNTIQITVVLASGQYITTNKYRYPDLFWAIRGGGGNTYGVVVSVTYRTHPNVSFQKWAFQATANNVSMLAELVEGYLSYQPNFTDNGWGGYGGVKGQGISFTYVAPNMTNETAAETMEPWMQFIQSLETYGVNYTSTSSETTWDDVLAGFMGAKPGGGEYKLIMSRLLSRGTVTENALQVAETLIGCNNSGISTVAGGKVNQFSPSSAGSNPLWRSTVAVFECSVTWKESMRPDEINEVIAQFHEWTQKLYDVTPNDGSYWNVPSPWENNWQESFFGSHYQYLLIIKEKYDPYYMFTTRYGVGSEECSEGF